MNRLMKSTMLLVPLEENYQILTAMISMALFLEKQLRFKNDYFSE